MARAHGQRYVDFLVGRPGPRDPALGRQGLEEDLRRLGDELGAALLPGPAGERLGELLDQTGVGETVEVIFEAADPDLLALPFEAIRLDDGRVPVLEPSVCFLRRLAPSQGPAAEPLAGPLKILVAIGAPDEDQTSSAVLDLEQELQGILDAVDRAAAEGAVEVKILEVGHPDEINRALKDDAFHVLHISGHGRPGKLELEDEEGRAVAVSAEEL
ncbi:MAG: CHAT domain-containing protein, partial [bacterium]|nr:CHAT domain-containing protein [bacterium]